MCVCTLSLYMWPVCMYVWLSAGTILLLGFFGTTQYCRWYQMIMVDARNHHCLSRVSGLSTRLLPDQITGLCIKLLPDRFLRLSSSHYCWGTGFGTILSPDHCNVHRADTILCQSTLVLWPSKTDWATLMQI